MVLVKFSTVLLYWYLSIIVPYISECYGLNINTSHLERPGKNLCVNQDVDCSNQVKLLNLPPAVPKAICLMKFLNKTSEECFDEEFKGQLDSEDKYGIVNVDRYLWFDVGMSFPALNITFKKINWKRLRLRFLKVGSNAPELCREFILSKDVDTSSVVSFDCFWGDPAKSGQDFLLQYVTVTKDNHKYFHNYLFRYPKDTEVNQNIDLEKYKLFLLMDKTALPNLCVKVQVPPPMLNISYANVTLFYKPDLESTEGALETWSVEFINKTEGEFVAVGNFNTDHSAGYYFFSASSCGNTCVKSSTPTLKIEDSRFALQATWALIIMASFLLLGLLGHVMWNKKYKKIIDDADKPPNVLFVYESCYPSHVENIYKFKEFLEAHCYVAPKLDLIDIEKSESKNPWKWYYKAFETADYVLVFASPDESTDRGVHEDDVYHHLHTYAIKLLLAYLLENKRKKHKFLVAKIKLPGCPWHTLPYEVKIVEKRFSLPEKLSHFFKFINIPPLKNGSSKFVNALNQSRNLPKLSVTRPSAPLPLPFDVEDFDLNSEAQALKPPLTFGGAVLNLDDSTSEEEDEDFPNELANSGLNL